MLIRHRHTGEIREIPDPAAPFFPDYDEVQPEPEPEAAGGAEPPKRPTRTRPSAHVNAEPTTEEAEPDGR